jgi:hypothetical protein
VSGKEAISLQRSANKWEGEYFLWLIAES